MASSVAREHWGAPLEVPAQQTKHTSPLSEGHRDRSPECC